MSTEARLSLLFVLLFCSVLSAQPQRALRSQPPAFVVAATDGSRVRFSSSENVCQIRAQIILSTGESLFDSDWEDGNVLDWAVEVAGQPLTSGSYRCVVTVKDIDGQVTTREANLTAQDGHVSLEQRPGSESLTIVGPDENGPKVTLLAHDGTNGAVVTTSGDLTFRFGNFLAGKDAVKMRLTAGGELSVDGMIHANKGIVFSDGTTLTTASGAAPAIGNAGGPAIATPGVAASRRPVVQPPPILPLAPRVPKPASGAPPAAQFVVNDTGVTVGTTNPAYSLTVTGAVTTSSSYGLNGVPMFGGSPSASLTWAGATTGQQGNYDSFFGAEAGRGNTTGAHDTFLGAFAGLGNSSGASNTFIGDTAGETATVESSNTAVGALADITAGVTGSTAIGANAKTAQSNTVILGSIFNVNGATATASTGIAIQSPNQYLGVGGGITVDENNLNNGSVLANSVIAFGTAASNGLSGEAIASQRTASGGNQYGLDFYTLFAKRMSISNSGQVAIYSLGAAGSTQLCFNASNQLATCSSSIRYKNDIANFKGGLDVVRRLQPVTFRWKDGGKRDVGLVAEQVQEVEPLLTTDRPDGQVEGVKYDHLTVVLINAVKELEQENKELRARIEKLERSAKNSVPR